MGTPDTMTKTHLLKKLFQLLGKYPIPKSTGKSNPMNGKEMWEMALAESTP